MGLLLQIPSIVYWDILESNTYLQYKVELASLATTRKIILLVSTVEGNHCNFVCSQSFTYSCPSSAAWRLCFQSGSLVDFSSNWGDETGEKSKFRDKYFLRSWGRMQYTVSTGSHSSPCDGTRSSVTSDLS
jgi:hypothetical protein